MANVDVFKLLFEQWFKWPATPWRLAVAANWALYEGMPEWANNPFASTQPGPLQPRDVGYGPGVWNSYGVKIYAGPETAAAALYQTMINGYYPNIIACFRDQKPYPAAERDFNIWINGPNGGSQGNYGPGMLAFMAACTAAKEEEVDPRIKAMMQIAWGDFDRMMNAYNAWVAQGLIPDDHLPALTGNDQADLPGAMQRRARCTELAWSDKFAQAWAGIGGK